MSFKGFRSFRFHVSGSWFQVSRSLRGGKACPDLSETKQQKFQEFQVSRFRFLVSGFTVIARRYDEATKFQRFQCSNVPLFTFSNSHIFKFPHFQIPKSPNSQIPKSPNSQNQFFFFIYRYILSPIALNPSRNTGYPYFQWSSGIKSKFIP